MASRNVENENLVRTPEQILDKSDQEQMPPPSLSMSTRSSTGSQKSGEIQTASAKAKPKNAPVEKSGEGETEREEGPLEKVKKVTPAVVRTRKLRHFFQSPSDAVMSPCSQELMAQANKPIVHPAIAKQKQKPKRLQQLND